MVMSEVSRLNSNKTNYFIDSQNGYKIKAAIYLRDEATLNYKETINQILKLNIKIIDFILEFPYYSYLDALLTFII